MGFMAAGVAQLQTTADAETATTTHTGAARRDVRMEATEAVDVEMAAPHPLKYEPVDQG
jgi:hypothetical protein